ncbi:TerB family tellurite resistance protein [Weeksellaceae bacterium TAE3-ERU29]|nr:TerB family tellurite resistance protein [Weeksellaceae bacterium TAE3-ERU29]
MENIIREAIRKYGIDKTTLSEGDIYVNLDGQLKKSNNQTMSKGEELSFRNLIGIEEEETIYVLFRRNYTIKGDFFTSTRIFHYSCCVLKEGIVFHTTVETDGWDKEEDILFFITWDNLGHIEYVNDIASNIDKGNSLIIDKDPTYEYFTEDKGIKEKIDGCAFYLLDERNYVNIPILFFARSFQYSRSYFINNLVPFFSEIAENFKENSSRDKEWGDNLLSQIKDLIDREKYEEAYQLADSVDVESKDLEKDFYITYIFYGIKSALKTNRRDIALELFEQLKESKISLERYLIEQDPEMAELDEMMLLGNQDKEIGYALEPFFKYTPEYVEFMSYYLQAQAEINKDEGNLYEVALAYDELKELKKGSGNTSDVFSLDRLKKTHYNDYIASFKEIDFQDRQLIVVSDTDKLFKSSHLTLVNRANLPQVHFPITHPKNNHTYVCHPFKKDSYLPIDNYDYELFNDRINEYCYLLQCLGATSISIESIKGEDNETHNHLNKKVRADDINIGLTNIKGNFENDRINDSLQKSNLKIGRHQTFNPTKKPFVPDNLVWLPNESGWQRLVQQRLDGDLLNHNEYFSSKKNQILSNSEITEINAELSVLFTSIKGGAEQKMETQVKNNKESEWKVSVTFKPMGEFYDNNTIDVTNLEIPLQDIPEIEVIDSSNKNEECYLKEVKFMLEDDGIIDEKERMILERYRKRFNITEERAKELESSIRLTAEEKEYLEGFREFVSDGLVSEKERRILNRLANSLGISEERIIEIEKINNK